MTDEREALEGRIARCETQERASELAVAIMGSGLSPPVRGALWAHLVERKHDIERRDALAASMAKVQDPEKARAFGKDGGSPQGGPVASREPAVPAKPPALRTWVLCAVDGCQEPATQGWRGQGLRFPMCAAHQGAAKR